MLSHGLLYSINRMMPHVRDSEIQQRLTQTATTANSMQRRFQGVSHGVLDCINRMMPHLKVTETHQPLS